MPKCFVFAIGGTGSRVLRSLTHLLAAGVKPKNNFDIVPIVIDPHHDNKDLQRTQDLMNLYKTIKGKAKPTDPNSFFPIEIKTLKDLNPDDPNLPSTFTFELEGANSTFSEFIGYNSMEPENKALTELLFSGYSVDAKKRPKLLDIEMDIGFVGNPNVGSVVLNQIVESKIYKSFASVGFFRPEDRIFIISSIFGGTGAAGFPCLLKNIRAGRTSIDGKAENAVLQDAKVGAISVLPYFKLQDNNDSPISYSDFIAKTRSALSYYEKTVTGISSKAVNAMYYIGDFSKGENYENDAGRNGQKNNANFVEIVGALAIIDFLGLEDRDLKCENGKAVSPLYREFGLKRDAARPDFYDLGNDHKDLIEKPLSQFALFRKFMIEEYPKKVGKMAWSTATPHQLDIQFVNDTFYRTQMKPFFDDFNRWLEELGKNERGFAPFNLEATELKLFINMPEDKKKSVTFTYEGSGIGPFAKKGFNDYLNIFAKETYQSKETKLIDMFYKTTKEILEKEYKI